jgi:hypothetical protein
MRPVPSAARVDIIQRNSEERWEQSTIHARLAVDDQYFMGNRSDVETYVAMQKMFGLRIIRSAEHLPDNDLVAAVVVNIHKAIPKMRTAVRTSARDSLLPFEQQPYASWEEK